MKVEELTGKKRLVLQSTGALLTGHFKLTSGLHSEYYLQCAKICQYPSHCEEIAKELAIEFSNKGITVTAAPAIGGILIGYELARALNCKSIFAERVDGKMQLRRGFSIQPDDRILIIEDVVTTGGSILEIADIAAAEGAEIIGFSAVLNRSSGRFKPNKPFFPWLSLEIDTYNPDDCPLCKQAIPLYQPGSRNLNK